MGDRVWVPVTWNGGEETGIEAGKGITLKFELYQARLYGIEFE